MIGTEPNLTFVIDVEPANALARGLARRSGEDRFEEMGLDFQHRLRSGFLALAGEAPARVRVIDGDRAAQEVGADVLAQVLARRGGA